MFLVVSRVPPANCVPDEIERALSATPNGRTVQAMLDLDVQNRSLENRHAESETDIVARLESIHRPEQLLGEAERDRAARLGVIEAQGAEIACLEMEAHCWLEENKRLWRQTAAWKPNGITCKHSWPICSGSLMQWKPTARRRQDKS